MKKIVYIHGLNSSGTIFNHIISKLPEHESILLDYESFDSIEDTYPKLIGKMPKNEDVSIIAHSLGGLFAFLVASRKNDIKVDRIATLSTPYAGSDHARMLKWVYPSFKILGDLSPRSAVMQEIQKSTMRAKCLALISIKGNLPLINEENDGVVTLASQRKAPTKKQIEIDSSHFEIVQDEKAINELRKFLFKSTVIKT